MKTIKNRKHYNFTEKQKRKDNHRTGYKTPTAAFKRRLNDRFDAKCKLAMFKLINGHEDVLFPLFVKDANWLFF